MTMGRSSLTSVSAKSLLLEVPYFLISNVAKSHRDRLMQELRTKLTISQSFDSKETHKGSENEGGSRSGL